VGGRRRIHGLFESAERFGNDVAATQAEVLRCGWTTERWLVRLAAHDPRTIDVGLVAEIHKRWFATTFPGVAGYIRRQEEVHNRKATAAKVPWLDRSSASKKASVSCGKAIPVVSILIST
jgi:hypothetical protein